MKLSVVIPAFNEAGNIGSLIREVREVIGSEPEIFVVDDGSTDATGEESAKERCTLLRHKVNRGKGAAMRTGLQAASGDIILFMGGDGQDDPRDIPTLLNGIRRGADFVIGSRFAPNHGCGDGGEAREGHKRYSTDAVRPVNEFGNKMLTTLVRLMFGLDITDSQAEFKCLRSDKLRNLGLVSERYEIETEMLIRGARADLRIVEVPVGRRARLHGKSKLYQVPFGRLRFGVRVLKTMIKGYLVWR